MPVSPVFSNIGSSVMSRDWNKTAPKQNNRLPVAAELAQCMPWLKDEFLQSSIKELRELKLDDADVRYLKNMGVNVPFKSGAQALDYIEKNNIRIMFDKTSEAAIHAQYDFSRNIITINERYKGIKDFSLTLAVSEAILHEAGHAKDFDGDSSIQEELDCLGMNAAAHRAFLKRYGNVFSDFSAPIIQDGVSIYANLFFDPDPDKQKLINRISKKYGDLPSGDRVHPPSRLAREISKTASRTHSAS